MRALAPQIAGADLLGPVGAKRNNALGEPKENDSKFKRGRECSKHLRFHACGLSRAWTNELTWSSSLLHPL